MAERVPWSRWEYITSPREVGREPGLYAIRFCSAIVYIGSSSNLRSRLSTYPIWPDSERPRCAPWSIYFDDRHELEVCVSGSRRAGDWLMREYRLVRRIMPRHNTHHVRRMEVPVGR